MWVVQNAVAHASRLSAAKMTNDILHGIYDLDFLATHSLIGLKTTASWCRESYYR